MIYLASLDTPIEAKVRGMQFIKTKEELDNLVAQTKVANKVIISKNFLAAYFTPSGLTKYLETAKRINRNLNIEVEVSMDYSEDKLLSMLAKCRNTEEVISLAVKYDKEFMTTVKNFADERAAESRELITASSTVSQLQSIIDSKNAEIEDLKFALNVEQHNKSELSTRLSALISRINYQYGANVKNSNRMFVTDNNSYDKILYIKEVTRVQHVDTLVHHLQEIFKILYNMPTRVVTIESYYAESKTDLYDVPPHYQLKEKDVLSGDILMLGYQPKLMEDIMRNPSRVSILIVLDRAGYDKLHLQVDKNMEVFYTVSDIDDIKDYSIPEDRVISYQGTKLFIPYVKDFNKLDDSEKMHKYSAMSITKYIVGEMEK